MDSKAGYADQLNLKPQTDLSRCTACGICVDQCPTGAIELKAFPVVDMTKCSACFVCQEKCPRQAIRLIA